MMISEPATMLTDYLLAVLLLVWGIRLWRAGQDERQRSMLLWAAGFFAAAGAAAVGGTFHGFRLYLDSTSAAALWKASTYLTGTASWAMLSAAFLATTSRSLRSYLLVFAAIKYVVFAIWMTNHTEFRFVIYDYAVSMACILVSQIGEWCRRGSKSAPWIVGGILVATVAAGIQVGKVSPHPQFNHNDLFHVGQMIGFYLFYRGGRFLTDCRS